MEQIRSLVSSGLEYIGIIDGSYKSVVLTGLDDAGKTTLCRLIKDPVLLPAPPTPRRTYYEVNLGINDRKLKLFELSFWTSTSSYIDRMMLEHNEDVNGFIYMIDGADADRFDESREGLHELLDWNDRHNKVPILILVNKIDKIDKQYLENYKIDESELKMMLGLYPSTLIHHTVFGYIRDIERMDQQLSIPIDVAQLCIQYYYDTSKSHISQSVFDNVSLKIFMCSLIKKVGFVDGIKWLANIMWSQ